jgi:hypothetical protein
MLHITNGESAVAGLKSGGVPGVFLSWDDPLHDGPVPAAPSLTALSDIRARALVDFGWGGADETRRRFAERDRTLEQFRCHDETVLWFEHDLYDQLQLIQLLDWFSRQGLAGTRVSLIQSGEYLGELNGDRLAALLPTRRAVAVTQLEAGREAWQAFCAPDPTGIAKIAGRPPDPSLPFLAAALGRVLEEYPSAANGLSRSEQQLLVSAALGARTRHALYRQSQSFEACPWGDLSVFLRLEGLTAGPHPVIDRIDTEDGEEFAINPLGARLLADEDDWLRLAGGIDRWIGGTHLFGDVRRWRRGSGGWDGKSSA